MKRDSRIWLVLALIAALAIAVTGRANESSTDPTGPDVQGHHGMMGDMSSMMGDMSSMMGGMGMMEECKRMMTDGSRGAPNEQWRQHRQPRPGSP